MPGTLDPSPFPVVAATLLDLKTAPAAAGGGGGGREEDLALLEARDLLFARLLQDQVFKEAAGHLATLMETGARRSPGGVAGAGGAPRRCRSWCWGRPPALGADRRAIFDAQPPPR